MKMFYFSMIAWVDLNDVIHCRNQNLFDSSDGTG